MHSRLFFIPLGVLAVLGAACGSGGGRADDLEAALPNLMPRADEVSQATSSQWDLKLIDGSSGVWNNAGMAEAEELTAGEVEQSGRLNGYHVFYKGGPHPEYPLVMADISISVYADDESAREVLRLGPKWKTGPVQESYDFGDDAVAWPMSASSGDSVTQHPSCPCTVLVRVGRLLASVDVSFGGPPYVSQFAYPASLELARAIADRMAEAQA